MSSCEVTVLMPAYNAELYIQESVESILGQTFGDFEFLIINDASTDATPAILEELAHRDCRIRVIHNAENLRIAKTLNKGLALAQAPLIARMDADDVSLPERLEKQVAFIRQNPEIGICGSALCLYDKPDEHWLPPVDNQAIRAKLFFESCLYHPTVIIRKNLLRHVDYRDDAVPAEDYDLWARMAQNSTFQFANLPHLLLRYRCSTNNHNIVYKTKQRDAADRVRKAYLHAAGIEATDAEMKIHDALVSFPQNFSPVNLWACKQWMTKLYFGVVSSGFCEPDAFRKEIMWRWQRLAGRNKHNPFAIGVYLVSEFGDWRVPLNKLTGKFKR